MKSRKIIIFGFLIGVLFVSIVYAETCKEGGYFKKDESSCIVSVGLSNRTSPIAGCSNPTVYLRFPETNSTSFNWSLATEISGIGEYYIYTPNLTREGVHSIFFNCTRGSDILSTQGRIEVVKLLPRERFENITVGQTRIITNLTSEVQQVKNSVTDVGVQQQNELQTMLQWERPDPLFGLEERDNILFYYTVKDGSGTARDLDGSLVTIFEQDGTSEVKNITNNVALVRENIIPGRYRFLIDQDLGMGSYQVRVRAETLNTTTYTWDTFRIVNKTAEQKIEESAGSLKSIEEWVSSVGVGIKGFFERVRATLWDIAFGGE